MPFLRMTPSHWCEHDFKWPLKKINRPHCFCFATSQGLSIRKRFRASSRHAKGKGLVIAIQTIAGHNLFSCTVGNLGHPNGIAEISLDSWACLEGMINVVKRTSHSSYYVEKGMSAMGKTAKQMGLGENMRVNGGGKCCRVLRISIRDNYSITICFSVPNLAGGINLFS
jgi:hypothetical protein